MCIDNIISINLIIAQYFRTTKNSHFKNPVLQNSYHINAIEQLIKIKASSVIVFTNSLCNLYVKNNDNDVIICKLNDLALELNDKIKNKEVVYSMEDIDELFTKLKVYSPIQEKVIIDGKEEELSYWLEPFICQLKKKKDLLKKKKKQ